MADSEELIRAVQKFSAIWDIESPDYHNKSMKEDAWSMVARILIADWETLNKGEKFISKTELKKRWNNIRDYYKKLLAQQRSGKIHKRKKKYVFADTLQFLRPVYDKSNAASHLANTRRRRRKKLMIFERNGDDGDSRHDSYEQSNDTCPNFKITGFDSEEEEIILRLNSDEEQDEQDKETITFVNCPTDHNLYTASTSKPPSKKAKVKNKVNSQAQKEKLDIEDADFSFLKSLLPDMKRLTGKQKFDFKFGILELYKKIADCRDNKEEFIAKQEVVSTQESEDDE